MIPYHGLKINTGGSKGAPGIPPPPRSNFFHFNAVFKGKNGQINLGTSSLDRSHPGCAPSNC